MGRHAASALALLLVGTLAIVACARRDQAAVEQQSDADALRRLHHGLARPLLAGDEALAAALPAAAARWWVFALTPDGAAALPGPPDAATCCREDVAVLLATADGGRHLVEPRSLAVRRLDGGRAALFRALLVTRPLSRAPGTLDLHRFDIAWTGGTPAIAGVRRLTADGGNAMPVHLPARRLVVYEHARADGRHELRRIGEDGGEAGPLLADGSEARQPVVDADGGVVYARREGAAWRLHRLDLASGASAPWSGGALADAGGLALACAAGDGGRVQPVLVGLPGRLPLHAALALVAARNPAVLRRRALYAAALVEARQLRLANLPSVHLGAFWTPAVGILTDAEVFSGDFLGQGLVRGIVGLTQSLLDIDRNRALSRAGAVRAQIAADALAEEIDRQQAEAALCHVAVQALRARLVLDRRLVGAAERAAATQARQRSAGRSSEPQALAAAYDLAAARGDLAADQAWLEVLTDRLRALCALPAGAAIEPEAPVRWEDAAVEPWPAALRTALLNHPRLRAARGAVREAFWNGQVGSRWRPSLHAEAAYAYTAYHAHDPVDDFVSLGLRGSVPLAWFADRGLERERAAAIDAALRAGEEAAAADIRRDLADAWAARQQALGELAANRAGMRSAQAAARAGLLRAEHGQPGAGRVLDSAGLHALERAALLAERAALDAWRVVAERHLRIVQAQGLAGTLAATAAALPVAAGVEPPPAGAWAWQRDRLLADGGAAALAAAAAHRIGRVHLYLGPDASALAADRERIAAFLARADAAGIAVWGLLGEPEWLDGDGGRAAVAAAAARIAAFQRDLAQRGGAGLRGVKLDSEPHVRPEWAAGGPGRAALAERWLALVRAARAGDLPLWVDLPVQLFRPEHAELRGRLAGLVDGAAAMCYSADPSRVRAHAALALAAWGGDLELGIELRPTAPADEGLAALPAAALADLRAELESAGAAHPRFHGVALHDLDCLIAPLPQPAAPPPQPPTTP